MNKKIFPYSFFCLIFFLGCFIYLFIKYPQPHKITDNNNHLKYYPKDLILKTGSRLESPENRVQHFLNFSTKKLKNTIRIGTFGDSYTYGSDVDQPYTYPSQLQNMLNEYFPRKKIEVLNFGVRGHSFQEQFFLYEKYSKTYKLDYILFGPKLYPNRDITFRKNWGDLFYPRHRYILSNKTKLKEVYIKGNTVKKRYKNYYRFIPTYTALRYDVKPFQLWEYYFGFLRHKFKNYFYYNKLSYKEESSKINTLLLNRVKKAYNTKTLFVLDPFPFIEKSYKYNELKKYYKKSENTHNFNYIIHSLEDKLFYRSFHHYSSLGYEIIANYFFHALSGKNQINLTLISCDFKKKSTLKSRNNIKLSQINSIKIFGNNIPLIDFILVYQTKSINQEKIENYKLNKREEIKSFIGFSSKNFDSFGNTVYFPVPFQLTSKMSIYIKSSNKKIYLGHINSLDNYKKFFNFYADYIENKFDGDYMSLYFRRNAIKEIKDSSKAYLFIENYRLGVLKKDKIKKKILKFIPTKKNISFQMTGPSKLKIKDIPYKFSLYTHYIMNNGTQFISLIPDYKCKKNKKPVSIKIPNFKPL